MRKLRMLSNACRCALKSSGAYLAAAALGSAIAAFGLEYLYRERPFAETLWTWCFFYICFAVGWLIFDVFDALEPFAVSARKGAHSTEARNWISMGDWLKLALLIVLLLTSVVAMEDGVLRVGMVSLVLFLFAVELRGIYPRE